MASVLVRTIFSVSCLLLILVSNSPMVKSFSLADANVPFCRMSPLKSKLFGPNDFDDEIGGSSDPQEEGDALAKDFYKELRKRRDANSEENASTMPDSDMPANGNDSVESSESAKFAAETFKSVDPPTPVPKKKFTGQQDRFFANQQQTSSSGPSSSSRVQGRTPREMMMEREYELVGRAEQGIVVQAAAAVAALIFYIYVGMSGGIVSGDEAMMESFGADDEIPFEQLMPIPSDREVSVWL